MIHYFKDCKTLNEVKALYRQLAKDNHPDNGGDTATMQAINTQYARAISIIANNLDLSPEDIDAEILNARQYQDAVNAIINLPGITIELCGGWLWVNGETKQYKDILKANGFYFAFKKLSWYFRSVEYKTRNHRPYSMDQIRNRYGSQTIHGKQFQTIDKD